MESICRQFELDRQRPVLYMIFSELLSNAIDHGVLGLSSALKDQGPQGFERYLRERDKRLARLSRGWVNVVTEYQSTEEQPGLLTITVRDSGRGFDVESIASRPTELTAVHGRGLTILRHLCQSVKHRGAGNLIVVEFAVE